MKKHKFLPLANIEIDSLLQDVKGFKGCFAKDEFKGKIKPLEFAVVNLDDSDGPGTHFAAFANLPNDEFVYYFDSYGVICPKNIEKYLKTSGKPIQYNNSHIQDIASNVCGWYTIQFIRELSDGESFYGFLSKFDDDQQKNDHNIRKWALTHYPNFFKK